MTCPSMGRLPVRLFLLGVLLALSGVSAHASPRGQLLGLVQDESGFPVSDVLVTLTENSSDEGLPVLTRSDESGRLFLKNMRAGSYKVLVKSSQYVVRKAGPVEILPGQTAVMTLVLQELLDVEGLGGRNVSFKTLLRNADPRLIFRHLPELLEGRTNPWFESAVFQVYSNAGHGGDYLRLPDDSAGATTANFGMVQSLPGGRDYIFAGQLNSGEDSLWRIKAFMDQSLSDRHSVRVFLGHGRIGVHQPRMALLGNPGALGRDLDFTNSPGTTNILSVGFEDRFSWGDTLALTWGLELNRVRSTYNYSTLSPSAELTLRPVPRARLQVTMSSKRPTLYQNSVTLEDGRTVGISDAVKISWVDNRLEFGTSRHYRGSLAYKLWENTELELARFQDQFFGGTVPFMAFFTSSPDPDLVRLTDDQARTWGNRLTLRQGISRNVRAGVSYLRGTAVSVVPTGYALVLETADVGSLLQRTGYGAVDTELGVLFPTTRTELTAVVKFVTHGDPVTPLDALSDAYETGNKGLNLFIRQIIPIPDSVLSFLGLDFLNGRRIEALLDIRNLTNEDLGVVSNGPGGSVVLAQNPRSVRGGVTVRF